MQPRPASDIPPAPAGSVRAATAARHRALHARLVDAAEAAVAAEGLAGLRARGLAAAAGCSVGAIYAIVPDLDALALEVNGRTLDAMEAALAGVAAGADPAEAMAGLAVAYLRYAAGHRARWGALFGHHMAQGSGVPGWYAARLDAVLGRIEAPLAVLRPDVVPAERAGLARTLFAAVHGVVVLGLDEKVVDGAGDGLEARVRALVGLLVRGLRQPDPVV